MNHNALTQESPAARTEAGPAPAPHLRHAPFAWLLLATGAVGWVMSFILVLERFEVYKNPAHVTSCDINPWISCGAVFGHWQASLFGFPNPIIGIVAFAVPVTTAVAMLAGAHFRRWYWLGLQAGVTLGFIFVVWLWSQALFDIYILCLYCMGVWAMMIPMFIQLTARNLAHGVIKAPEAFVRFFTSWSWTFTALLWIATAASVFFRFLGAFTAA